MIESFSITITEVDDVEFALEELEAQMAGIKLLKSTVGIVSVYPGFVKSGVYAAVAKAVPFPLVGMATYSQGANGKSGKFLFSILALTSDACEFAHGFSDAIPQKGGDVAGLTRDFYNSLSSKLGGSAKLAVLLTPYMEGQSIHTYIAAISGINKNLPVFGSVACADLDKLLTEAKTLHGENGYSDRLAMLLVSGDISPEFYIGSVTRDAIVVPNIGEVTAARSNVVTEINNMGTVSFFQKKGFETGADRNQGLLTSTFVVDEKDSAGNIVSTSSRALFALNEDGGVFGGNIAVGSVLSLATVTKDVVMTTAQDVINRIKEKRSGKTILMYSCMGRLFSLLDEPIKEYELFSRELANDGYRYSAACSFGEICPTSVTENGAYNSEHNQTLVACVF